MSTPKPGVPVLNPSHAFGVGLIAAVPFTEGAGVPAVMVGPSGSGTPTVSLTSAPTSAWTTNSDGAALALAATDFLTSSGIAVPTSAITVCVIRRKTDATLRNSGLFGQNAGSTAARRCGASAPKADGVVSWWFGGSTSPNLLTASGLSFGTTVESLIFTGGAAGSAIWQNGAKVASQVTAITRGAGTNSLCLNRGIESGVTTGDIEELNYFAIYDVQWDDATCVAWSADPYAHLVAAAGFPTTYYAQQRGQAI